MPADLRYSVLNVIAELAVVVVIGKACMRVGQIGIEQKPVGQHRVIAPFHAVALAGTIGRRASDSGIRVVDQFRFAVQTPQRQRTLKARQDLGAHTDFLPERPHQRRHG